MSFTWMARSTTRHLWKTAASLSLSLDPPPGLRFNLWMSILVLSCFMLIWYHCCAVDLFSLIAISCTAGAKEAAGRMISNESANMWSEIVLLLHAIKHQSIQTYES